VLHDMGYVVSALIFYISFLVVMKKDNGPTRFQFLSTSGEILDFLC